MSALPAANFNVSLAEYLEQERSAEVKHEYLGGMVYAMAGASTAHNDISVNLIAALHAALRGSGCRTYGSDMQVRVPALGRTACYYPDALIACDPADKGNGWRERPGAVFEIISDSTRATDEREKRLHYLNVENLEKYLRLEQKSPLAVVDRRTPAGWQTEVIAGLEKTVVFSVNGREISLPLASLYEGVEF